MRVLPVIVLFSTILLQTNLVYGGGLLSDLWGTAEKTGNKVNDLLGNLGGKVSDGVNTVVDGVKSLVSNKIEVEVEFTCITPGIKEEQHYSFTVVTNATELLVGNSKYRQEISNIKYFLAQHGSSAEISKKFMYVIKPDSVSSHSALKQLALNIENQIEREPNTLYFVNVKPNRILEIPKIVNPKFNLRITLRHAVPGVNLKHDITFEVLTDGTGILPNYIEQIAAMQLQLQKTYNCGLAQLDIEYFIVVVNGNSLANALVSSFGGLLETQLLSLLHIKAEITFETGNFEEYDLRLLIDFYLPHSNKKYSRETVITTNPSILLDNNEVLKQLNEIKKSIALEYAVSVTNLKYQFYLFITALDNKESLDFVDINKKVLIVQNLINVAYKVSSSKLCRLTVTITYKLSGSGKEIKRNFEVLSDGVSPLNKTEVVEKINAANYNFKAEYGVTYLQATTSYAVHTEFGRDLSPQEHNFFEKLITEVQEILKGELTVKLSPESRPTKPKVQVTVPYKDAETGKVYKESFDVEVNVAESLNVAEVLEKLNQIQINVKTKYGLSNLVVSGKIKIVLKYGSNISQADIAVVKKIAREISTLVKQETSESKPKNPKEVVAFAYSDSKTGKEYKETFEIEVAGSSYNVGEFLEKINQMAIKLVEKYGFSLLEVRTAARIYFEHGNCQV